MTMLTVSMTKGDSFLHRLNPLAKLAWVVAVIAVAFSTSNAILLLAICAAALVVAAANGLLPVVLRGCTVLVPIGASLIFLQSVAPALAKPWTTAAVLGPFSIYQEGMYWGLVLLGRIVAVLIVALLLTTSTHPGDLFTALGKLRVPHNVNFMLSMTLQLIPVFEREFGIVLSAQKSRGMKARGFQALIPSLVPVFVGAIERVQQLAISLESRGYGSSGTKTHYRDLTVRWSDWGVGVAAAVFLVVLVSVSIAFRGWSLRDQFVVPGPVAIGIVLVSAGAFAALLVVAWVGSRRL